MMPSDCHYGWDVEEPITDSNESLSNFSNACNDQVAGNSQEATHPQTPQNGTSAEAPEVCDTKELKTCEEELQSKTVKSCAFLRGADTADANSPQDKKLYTGIAEKQGIYSENLAANLSAAEKTRGSFGSHPRNSVGNVDLVITESRVSNFNDEMNVGNGHLHSVTLEQQNTTATTSSLSNVRTGNAPTPLSDDSCSLDSSVRHCCKPLAFSMDENQNVAARSVPEKSIPNSGRTVPLRSNGRHSKLSLPTVEFSDTNYTSAGDQNGTPENEDSGSFSLSAPRDLCEGHIAFQADSTVDSSSLLHEQTQPSLPLESSSGACAPHPWANPSLFPRVCSADTDSVSNHSGQTSDCAKYVVKDIGSLSLSLPPNMVGETHPGTFLQRSSSGGSDFLFTGELQQAESGLSQEPHSTDSDISLPLSSAIEVSQKDSGVCQEFSHSSSVSPAISTINVDHIPDELVLKIFSFLSPQELCRHVIGVCHRWRALAYDSSLWRKVDVSCWRVDGAQLQQLVLRVPGAVHYLDMSGLENLTMECMVAVAENCQDLTHLDVGFVDNFNSSMLQLVLTSCPKLHFLNVEGCRYANNEMMRVLVNSAGPELRQLNFSHCSLVDESLLLMIYKIPGITHLNIDGISWISETAVQQLASRYSDTLESWELDGNELTDATMYFVSFCHRLKVLSVSFCERLTDQTFNNLLRVEKLEKLVLRKGPSFTGNGLMEFFSTCIVVNLTHLDLTECQQLEDEGVMAISQTCGPKLRTLFLSWCWDVTDKGMGHIANSCPNMVKMYLVGLHRLEGLWLPLAVEYMPNLNYISFEQCNEVQDNVIEEAVRDKPDLIIHNYYGEEFVHRRLH